MRFQVRVSCASVVVFRFREQAEEFARSLGLRPSVVREVAS